MIGRIRKRGPNRPTLREGEDDCQAMNVLPRGQMFKFLQLLKQGLPRNDAVRQLTGARASDAPNSIVASTVCVDSSKLRHVELMTDWTGVCGSIREISIEVDEGRQAIKMLPR